MKLISALLCLVWITGCASSRIDSKLKPFVGKPASELMKTWGPPDDIRKVDTGNQIYIYRDSRMGISNVGNPAGEVTPVPQFQKGPDGFPVPNTVSRPYNTREVPSSPTSRDFWCKVSFEITPAQLVRDFSYEGNSCK